MFMRARLSVDVGILGLVRPCSRPRHSAGVERQCLTNSSRQIPLCTPLVLVKLFYGPPTCPTRGGIVHVIEYTATPDAAGLSIKRTTPRYHGPRRTTACHCFSKMVCSVCKLERTCGAELVVALQLVGILPVASFLCKVCIMALIRTFTDSQ